MKTQERIIINKNQQFRWLEVIKTDKSFKFIPNIQSKNINDKTIFQDDIITFEPSKLYKGKEREFISCSPKHFSIKWVVVKSRHIDKFDEVVSLYSRLTNQELKYKIVRKVSLFKNSVFVLRFDKCKLDRFPTKIDLNFSEIKSELESIFKQKSEVSSKRKYLVKNKIVEI